MELSDLSSWLGRPPPVARHDPSGPPQEEKEEAELDAELNGIVDEIVEPTVAEDGGTTKLPEESPNENQSRDQDELEMDVEAEGPSSVENIHPSPSQEGHSHYFLSHVEIPHVTDKGEYGLLPGSEIVERILAAWIVPDDTLYKVRLRSQEIEIVTEAYFLTLNGAETALDQWNKPDNMSLERRHSRKARPSGYVGWDTLNISSSDEDTKRPSAPQPSRRRQQSSHLSANVSQTSHSAPRGNEESDSYASSPEPATRRSQRTLPRRIAYQGSSDDQLVGEDSSDSDVKEFRRKARTRPRGRPKRARGSDENELDLVLQGTRRSERTQAAGARRSMRERLEDEISENEVTPVGTKVVATRESFVRLAEDDEFRLHHRVVCDTCLNFGDSKEKGPLVFCQGCTNSYHKSCLGNRGSRDHLVTKVFEDHFVLQCRRCLGLAHQKDSINPHQGTCIVCKEMGAVSEPFRERLSTRQEQQRREENGGKDPISDVDPSLINNVHNLLFRCATCQRGWHLHHLPPKEGDLSDDEEMKPDEQIAEERFKPYSKGWTCRECFSAPGPIDGLVAWRPTDLETFVPGVTVEMMDEVDKEYLVKWARRSHFRDTWMPGAWIYGVCAPAMRKAFMKNNNNQAPKMRTEDAVPEEYLRVDIILDVKYTNVVTARSKEIDFARVKEVDEAYIKFKGLNYEDAIWEKPPNIDDTERWADFKIAYEDFVLGDYVVVPKSKTLKRHLAAAREQDFESSLLKEEQPSSMTGGQMMEYQIEGMNWLYYRWYQQQNAILADEMGLGKTIQVIAFFATMIQDHKCWPFLVVVPNSTCPNWRREVKKWVPSLRVVTYYGSSTARKLAHTHELFPRGVAGELRAHIVITSYESMVDENARRALAKIPWQGLVVDEGQRLKNEKNLLYDALSKINFPYKVLLTGTPLQNNARELFNLLQFLDKKIDAAKLEAQYETLTKDNVPELHELLRPFFLRRTKVQVLTFLPPMAQIILPVTMTVVQKKLYKSILAKNPQLIKAIFGRDGPVKGNERHNLNNILMQLRKVLVHPFVYSRAIEERSMNPAVSHRGLVDASSKLQLLEIMLPKLQERDHRVLIFSQFLDFLDIVEDFLDGLALMHHRLDGSINSLEKQKRIDEFNDPDSPYFAFLLSTRAGGVGINLASADTVFIMDPDFNPHQDIQALSRAHRIGQKKKVLIFQVMTRGSAEEKIMQIGKKKMALDHVLIERMDQEDDAGMDLESILRHGAQALFEDDSTADITYDAVSVDKLLDRSQVENTKAGDDNSAESQFSFARVWANDKAALDDNLGDPEPATPDPTVWEKILKERERAVAEEEAARAETLGRGKRRRLNVDYTTQEEMAGLDQELFSSPQKGRDTRDESDTDFQARGDTDVDVSEDGGEINEKEVRDVQKELSTPTVKARPFKRAEVPTGPAPYSNGMDGAADWAPKDGRMPPARLCPACVEVHPIGYCRLKLAGVEHCGLCGLAHSGHGRTCPHLNSEVQVATMLRTLKESTEARDLTEKATKYLRMIRGDLVQRKKMAAARGQQTKAPIDTHQPIPGQIVYGQPQPPQMVDNYPYVNGQPPAYPPSVAPPTSGQIHLSTFPRFMQSRNGG